MKSRWSRVLRLKKHSQSLSRVLLQVLLLCHSVWFFVFSLESPASLVHQNQSVSPAVSRENIVYILSFNCICNLSSFCVVCSVYTQFTRFSIWVKISFTLFVKGRQGRILSSLTRSCLDLHSFTRCSSSCLFDFLITKGPKEIPSVKSSHFFSCLLMSTPCSLVVQV